MNNCNALVLFSGGQDSTTCLAWALDRYQHVETIGFDYGQKHRIELEVRPRILEVLRSDFPAWGAKLGPDHILDLSILGQVSETALTRDVEISVRDNGLPNTFVPGRNLIFLTLAAAVAYRRDAKHLVTGVCEMDYSGYPDCRDDTVKAMQLAVNLGMETRFVIHTPLMWIDKAQTWALAEEIWGASADRPCASGDAHLLPRRSRAPSHLGLWLWSLSGLRTSSPGLGIHFVLRKQRRRPHMQQRLDRLRRREGAVLFLAFAACVPFANWLIDSVGTVCSLPYSGGSGPIRAKRRARRRSRTRIARQRRLGLAWSAVRLRWVLLCRIRSACFRRQRRFPWACVREPRVPAGAGAATSGIS